MLVPDRSRPTRDRSSSTSAREGSRRDVTATTTGSMERSRSTALSSSSDSRSSHWASSIASSTGCSSPSARITCVNAAPNGAGRLGAPKRSAHSGSSAARAASASGEAAASPRPSSNPLRANPRTPLHAADTSASTARTAATSIPSSRARVVISSRSRDLPKPESAMIMQTADRRSASAHLTASST
jgi:hypothetical protein